MPDHFATLCDIASYYQRKKSPFYWLRIRKPDGTWEGISSGIRVTSPGAIRKVQQRVSTETAKEIRQSDDGAKAIFRNWVPQWIHHHYTNTRSAERAVNAWAHLAAYFKVKGIIHPEEVTYGVCHSYMKWRTNAKDCQEENRRLGNWNTALTELRILGTIMQEALAQEWVLANPCARLRLGRKAVKEKPPFEREDQTKIEAALQTAPEWMQDSWLVGIKHGCRLSEGKVPMDRISTTATTMAITFKIKGGKFHTAPLHKDLLPLVERRREEKAQFLVDLPPNASRDWNKWLTDNGFPDHSYHCLRVTVITRFAQADVTAEKAMQYVGHCTEMCHAIYRKLRPKDVASLGAHL